MFQVRLASRLLAYRGFATAVLRNGPVVEGKARNVHPVYAKMKETSKIFQVNDGRSVHVKRGGTDDAIFLFLHVMAVVVFCMTVRDIYDFAYPEKKED